MLLVFRSESNFAQHKVEKNSSDLPPLSSGLPEIEPSPSQPSTRSLTCPKWVRYCKDWKTGKWHPLGTEGMVTNVCVDFGKNLVSWPSAAADRERLRCFSGTCFQRPLQIVGFHPPSIFLYQNPKQAIF